MDQKNLPPIESETKEKAKKIRRCCFAIVIFLFIIVAIPLLWLNYHYPTTSPIKAFSYLRYYRNHPHQNLSKRTIGYAPYWQIDKMQNVHFDLLSDLIYFSLTVDDQGRLAKKTIKGEDDPGWTAWNQRPAGDLIAETQISGGRAGLTLALLKNYQIKTFLNSEQNQKNLLEELINEVKHKRLKLVNFDFEYTGEPPEELPTKFTVFIEKARQEFDSKVPGTEIDINLKARSGRDPGLFQIDQLATHVDKFIVMSYDYYTAGSDSAGPVAPLSGKESKKYFFDIETTYNDLAKLLPRNQIIMGIPYYGYDWPVKDKTNPRSLALDQSDANGYVETLSYGRARDDAKYSGDNCHFEEAAGEPWCGYTDDKTGSDRVAWFENNRSIKLKYDYAKNQDFAGVAIWTLNYDRNYSDLWELLGKTFETK